jgi:transcriptional regulator with XRE-family HTH domain
MTPAQCRAARGLLDWTQAQLAEAAGLALATVVKFERSGRAVPAKAVQAMQLAFEAAGVEFIAENGSGVGVRMKKGKIEVPVFQSRN